MVSPLSFGFCTTTLLRSKLESSKPVCCFTTFRRQIGSLNYFVVVKVTGSIQWKWFMLNNLRNIRPSPTKYDMQVHYDSSQLTIVIDDLNPIFSSCRSVSGAGTKEMGSVCLCYQLVNMITCEIINP